MTTETPRDRSPRKNSTDSITSQVAQSRKDDAGLNVDLDGGSAPGETAAKDRPIREKSISTSINSKPGPPQSTVIQQCIESELTRYFALLDGQAPHDLHRMVMSQVEKSLLRFVLDEVGNNQSKAAEYLGISRGTLRSRICEHGV